MVVIYLGTYAYTHNIFFWVSVPVTMIVIGGLLSVFMDNYADEKNKKNHNKPY
jgi:hypothetical protein